MLRASAFSASTTLVGRGNGGACLQEVRVDVYAEAGAGGYGDGSVVVAAEGGGGAVIREVVVELP